MVSRKALTGLAAILSALTIGSSAYARCNAERTPQSCVERIEITRKDVFDKFDGKEYLLKHDIDSDGKKSILYFKPDQKVLRGKRSGLFPQRIISLNPYSLKGYKLVPLEDKDSHTYILLQDTNSEKFTLVDSDYFEKNGRWLLQIGGVSLTLSKGRAGYALNKNADNAHTGIGKEFPSSISVSSSGGDDYMAQAAALPPAPNNPPADTPPIAAPSQTQSPQDVKPVSPPPVKQKNTKAKKEEETEAALEAKASSGYQTVTGQTPEETMKAVKKAREAAGSQPASADNTNQAYTAGRSQKESAQDSAEPPLAPIPSPSRAGSDSSKNNPAQKRAGKPAASSQPAADKPAAGNAQDRPQETLEDRIFKYVIKEHCKQDADKSCTYTFKDNTGKEYSIDPAARVITAAANGTEISYDIANDRLTLTYTEGDSNKKKELSDGDKLIYKDMIIDAAEADMNAAIDKKKKKEAAEKEKEERAERYALWRFDGVKDPKLLEDTIEAVKRVYESCENNGVAKDQCNEAAMAVTPSSIAKLNIFQRLYDMIVKRHYN